VGEGDGLAGTCAGLATLSLSLSRPLLKMPPFFFDPVDGANTVRVDLKVMDRLLTRNEGRMSPNGITVRLGEGCSADESTGGLRL